MATFEVCVQLAFAKMNLPADAYLKTKQIEVLRSLYDGRDTVAILPTGFGKSLIYQMLPFMMAEKKGKEQPMIVIVVTPINAIMEEQVRILTSRGIRACYLSYASSGATTYNDEEVQEETEGAGELLLPKEVTMKQLQAGEYTIIYSHPETLFNDKKIASLLRCRLYKEMLCGIVIDEAHIILQWGQTFRTKFGQLGDLVCLHADVVHLALTATAKPDALQRLTTTLMFNNANVIVVNPDRPNIFIEIASRPPNVRKIEKYFSFIKPVAEELKLRLDAFPVTVAYVESLEALGFCYKYINSVLKNDQYNGKTPIPENRIFAQYHTDYTLEMKRIIISDLSKNIPTIRLVLATVAIGMGLNSPSIVRVLHMRPPVSLEHYLQETGRAGRSEQTASALMFYNNSDIAANRKGLKAGMVEFCKNKETCLRLHLVKYFGFDNVLFNGDKKYCCINCRKQIVDTVLYD